MPTLPHAPLFPAAWRPSVNARSVRRAAAAAVVAAAAPAAAQVVLTREQGKNGKLRKVGGRLMFIQLPWCSSSSL